MEAGRSAGRGAEARTARAMRIRGSGRVRADAGPVPETAPREGARVRETRDKGKGPEGGQGRGESRGRARPPPRERAGRAGRERGAEHDGDRGRQVRGVGEGERGHERCQGRRQRATALDPAGEDEEQKRQEGPAQTGGDHAPADSALDTAGHAGGEGEGDEGARQGAPAVARHPREQRERRHSGREIGHPQEELIGGRGRTRSRATRGARARPHRRTPADRTAAPDIPPTSRGSTPTGRTHAARRARRGRAARGDRRRPAGTIRRARRPRRRRHSSGGA